MWSKNICSKQDKIELFDDRITEHSYLIDKILSSEKHAFTFALIYN